MNNDIKQPEVESRLPVPARFTDRPGGVEVTLAEPEDIDQLSRVIAAAFHDLNASHFLIPDEDDRRKIYPAFFRLTYAGPGVANGVVHRTADSLACAVWLPMGDPSVDEGGASGHSADRRGETAGLGKEEVGGGPDPDAELELLTGTYFPNFVEFDRLLTEAHGPYLHIPHDFLGVVGAHPTVQRQGNLRSLMAAWLPELDRQGRGSYLEAAEPYLVPVYEKYGYRRTDHITHLPTCPTFPLWREPQGVSDRSGTAAGYNASRVPPPATMVRNPKDEPSDRVQSVSRALGILEAVGASPDGLTVKQIARRCELRTATTYHQVRTLRLS